MMKHVSKSIPLTSGDLSYFQYTTHANILAGWLDTRVIENVSTDVKFAAVVGAQGIFSTVHHLEFGWDRTPKGFFMDLGNIQYPDFPLYKVYGTYGASTVPPHGYIGVDKFYRVELYAHPSLYPDLLVGDQWPFLTIHGFEP